MTLASHTPATWDDILSTTMHNVRKQLTDNVFNGRPLLNYLMSNGRVRTISGGISIVEPLLYAEGDWMGYGEWDAIDVKPVNTATAAQFPWRQLVATIAISGLEEAQNNSTEMRVNLLEAKVMQAEETLKAKINQMLYGTLAGYDDTIHFGSLDDLIDDTAAAGGIDPATEAWWASGVDAVGAVDAAGLEAAFSAAYINASDAGNDKVNAMFTDPTVYQFYESTLTPQVRYSDVEKANLGFQNLLYKNCPIFWDFDCTAGTVYGLNSKYVGLTLHTDRNFKQSPFTANLTGLAAGAGSNANGVTAGAAASTLDARVSFISTYGNTTIRNRRRCFKLTGVAAA